MKKYVAEKLMELAALERDIQNLYMKVKNPGNVMYACSNPTLKKIKEHVELLEIQLFELKGDLAERDCRIHSMQVELDDYDKQLRLHNVSVSLLERAASLVGNPGTNISGSTDMACDEWQKDYERWRNER